MWSKLGRFFSQSSKYVFAIGLLALIISKLWLVHTEEIFGATTKYDSLWFLESAKHWYWNTAYSWIAFCRPPAYPLFIAIVHAWGISLRVAIELLQIGGYVALIGALRTLRFSRGLAFIVFALFLFHPESFQRNNYVQADAFYTAILTYTVAGILFTLVTRQVFPAICSGGALAVLWNTREESILLVPIFLTYIFLALYPYYRQTRSWGESARKIFVPAATMLVTAVFFILTVNTINYRTFGTFEKSDMTDPNLRAAYRALLRIKTPHMQRFVSISQEAREIAYSVSPTFARLKPYFESELGRSWEGHGTPNEIGTGWFIWALRQMSDCAGAYHDPATAGNFYRAIAQEINLACDQKRIPSRWVLSPFIDPNATASFRYLSKSFRKIQHLFFLGYKISFDREDEILNREGRNLYDEMAGRTTSQTSLGNLRIVGWAFRFNDPMLMLAHDVGGGEIDSATSSFGDRPDVVKQFESEGEVPQKNEFGLPLVVRRKGDPAGQLVFITQTGRKFIGSTQSILAGQAPTENGETKSEQLHCRIFAQEFTPSNRSLSQSFEVLVGKFYHYILRGFTLAGATALILLAFYFRRWRLSDPGNILLVLVALIVTTRVVFFTFVDTTAFPGIDPRFLFPVMPLYSLLQVALIYQAVRTLSSPATLKS